MADTDVGFEQALHELGRRCTASSPGKLSLEEASRVRAGVRARAAVNGKLAGVEERVEVLMRDRDGKLRTCPLDPEQE